MSLIEIRRQIVLLEREEWKLREFKGDPPETIFIARFIEAIEKTPNILSWYRIKDVAKLLNLNNRDKEKILKVLLKIYPEILSKKDYKNLGIKTYSALIQRKNRGVCFQVRPWMIQKWKNIYIHP